VARLAVSIGVGSVDRDYIAPQLTVREMLVAGTYVMVDMFLLLFVIGIPALIANFFSPVFPRRWKLWNALALLIPLVLVGAIVALIVHLA
jgi:hypothetical protein